MFPIAKIENIRSFFIHGPNPAGATTAEEDFEALVNALRASEVRERELQGKLAQVVAISQAADDLRPFLRHWRECGIVDGRSVCDCGLDEAADALTHASALAAQCKREIQREALRVYGQHQRAIPELGVKGCDYDPEEGIPCTCGLAAILGEKGGDDGSV